MTTTSARVESPTVTGTQTLGCTRQAEATTVVGLAAPGRGVLVVGHPGEGRTDVTSQAQLMLRRAQSPSLRCTAQTTTADLLTWFEASYPAGALRLDDVDTLPPAVTTALSSLAQDPRAILLMTADTVAMRSASSFDNNTPVGLLCDLWRRRLLGRVDLAPLTDEETAARLRAWVPTEVLDSLQIMTATRAARGSAALARDLAEDLTASAHTAPRALPRPWDTPFPLSPRTLHRIASRCRDLHPATRAAGVVLHGVGPLDHGLATRLVGQDVLARLINSGVASQRRVPDGDEVDVDGFQAAGLLSMPDIEGVMPAQQRALSILERSWRSGLPLSDAPTLALARHYMDMGRFRGSARLFTHAAKVTARLGWPKETERLARTAMADGAGPEVLPTLWSSLLRQDRHHEVLDLAQQLLNSEPDSFELEHLHGACSAASWVRSTPQWLMDHLTHVVGAVDPVLAQILLTLTGDASLTDQLADNFGTYAADCSNEAVPRMWATALNLTHRLSAGDPEELVAAVTQARSLRGRLRMLNPKASSMVHKAFLLVDMCCCSAQALAGVDPDGAKRVVQERTVKAVEFGADSGRVAACSAIYLNALSHYRRGNTEAAARDITAAMSMLDHSTFATVNASFMRLSLQLARSGPQDEVDPEVLGFFQEVGEPIHEGAAGPTALAPAPGWATVAHLYHRVLQGHLTAEEALEAISDPELSPGSFPATLAAAEHMRALVSGGPEELLCAADALTRAGLTRGARDALTQARSAFLSRRATGRANDCAAKLANLPDADVAPENPPGAAELQRHTGTSRRTHPPRVGDLLVSGPGAEQSADRRASLSLCAHRRVARAPGASQAARAPAARHPRAALKGADSGVGDGVRPADGACWPPVGAHRTPRGG